MINSTVAEPSCKGSLRWVQGSIPARELCFESHLLLYSKPRGYRSRQLVTHEDRSLSCTVTGGWSISLATGRLYTNTVLHIVCARI